MKEGIEEGDDHFSFSSENVEARRCETDPLFGAKVQRLSCVA